MKALLALSVALAVALPVQAELFRPHAGRGDRGHVGPRHSPHVSWSGHSHGGYVYRHHPSVYVGFGPAYYPAYGYYPGYGADYPYYGSWGGYYGSGSAASSGFWLGALAGGIIGHNSGEFRHNGWRGAAWGAGVGWLLGSIADANRRPVTYAPAQGVSAPAASVVAPVSQPAAAPQQVTIINNYYNSSPMSGANSLFGR
jgi:hypothetical protein